MNKPVAWMQTWQNQDGELKQTVNIEQIGKNDIPLYTHPVKELTDEDVIERLAFLKDHGASSRFLQIYEEAVRWTLWAILRKAQEK